MKFRPHPYPQRQYWRSIESAERRFCRRQNEKRCLSPEGASSFFKPRSIKFLISARSAGDPRERDAASAAKRFPGIHFPEIYQSKGSPQNRRFCGDTVPPPASAGRFLVLFGESKRTSSGKAGRTPRLKSGEAYLLPEAGAFAAKAIGSPPKADSPPSPVTCPSTLADQACAWRHTPYFVWW